MASAWPVFSQRIAQEAGREVEIVSVNRGATSLVHAPIGSPFAHPLWDPTVDCTARAWGPLHAGAWEDEPGDLFCLLFHAVEQAGVGDRLAAVLWHQGEMDGDGIQARLVTKAQYKAALNTLVDEIHARLGVPTIIAQVSLCQFPDDPCTEKLPLLDRGQIRAAQLEVIAENENALPGPNTDDLEHVDGVHIQDVVTLGDRWADSVKDALDSRAECGNGIDDDSDGFIDHPEDPGCIDAASETESPECDDGIDNDGDSLVDHPADASCRDASGATELSRCQNGLDDDGDGGIDFDGGATHNGGTPLAAPDAECVGRPHRNQEIRDACGIGAELALLLPAIALFARPGRSARGRGQPFSPKRSD
jgi:hypothetical protein